MNRLNDKKNSNLLQPEGFCLEQREIITFLLALYKWVYATAAAWRIEEKEDICVFEEVSLQKNTIV